MACDVNDILADATCIQCKVSPGLEMTILIKIMCNVANAEPPPPVSGDFRISNVGDVRISNVGDERIWQ